LPGLLTNYGVYLALARCLLGLPDDYQDPTTVRLHAEWEKEREANHPDIRTIEGLFREVLIAYGEVICSLDREATEHDWVDLSYRMLRRRHGSSSWKESEAGQRADFATALSDVHSNPVHADIRDINIAVFAMLYANGLAWAGKISAKAITMVVNRIADAAEDGALEKYLDKVFEEHEKEVDAFAKALFPVRRGRGRKRTS